MLKIIIPLLFLVGCATESDIITLRVQLDGLEGTVSRVQKSATEAKQLADAALASATNAEKAALEAEANLKQINDMLSTEEFISQ